MKMTIKKITLLSFVSVFWSHGLQANQAFNDYWYAGKAELTSYAIEQARYGEIHKGKAVLIYVTEQFLPKAQVKADNISDKNTTVLKLNKHKQFLTGIYPYSIMTSVFSPVDNIGHAIKISNSTQEWCGNTYSQLNNREGFDIRYHSYFEGEADKYMRLDKTHLEDEIWNKIRLNPTSLPIGDVNMIPAFEYTRLMHIPLQAYKANLSLDNNATSYTYHITYPKLERTLSITFDKTFPFMIQSWRDEYRSGFDKNAKRLTSTGKRINTIKSQYWQQKTNAHRSVRKQLGLSEQ